MTSDGVTRRHMWRHVTSHVMGRHGVAWPHRAMWNHSFVRYVPKQLPPLAVFLFSSIATSGAYGKLWSQPPASATGRLIRSQTGGRFLVWAKWNTQPDKKKSNLNFNKIYLEKQKTTRVNEQLSNSFSARYMKKKKIIVILARVGKTKSLLSLFRGSNSTYKESWVGTSKVG